MKTALVKDIGRLLKGKRWRLAVAESCTGGALASAITDIPGASEYFERGVVTYSNASKTDLLGVRAGTLKKFGAVSGVAAKEMAEGMRERSGADIALAVTGIAGPGGGGKEKPVGTVYIALATARKTQTKHFCFKGSRLKFKKSVVEAALGWVQKELTK